MSPASIAFLNHSPLISSALPILLILLQYPLLTLSLHSLIFSYPTPSLFLLRDFLPQEVAEHNPKKLFWKAAEKQRPSTSKQTNTHKPNTISSSCYFCLISLSLVCTHTNREHTLAIKLSSDQLTWVIAEQCVSVCVYRCLTELLIGDHCLETADVSQWIGKRCSLKPGAIMKPCNKQITLFNSMPLLYLNLLMRPLFNFNCNTPVGKLIFFSTSKQKKAKTGLWHAFHSMF